MTVVIIAPLFWVFSLGCTQLLDPCTGIRSRGCSSGELVSSRTEGFFPVPYAWHSWFMPWQVAPLSCIWGTVLACAQVGGLPSHGEMWHLWLFPCGNCLLLPRSRKLGLLYTLGWFLPPCCLLGACEAFPWLSGWYLSSFVFHKTFLLMALEWAGNLSSFPPWLLQEWSWQGIQLPTRRDTLNSSQLPCQQRGLGGCL